MIEVTVSIEVRELATNDSLVKVARIETVIPAAVDGTDIDHVDLIALAVDRLNGEARVVAGEQVRQMRQFLETVR